MSKSNIYKLAAIGVLLICFGMVSVIIGSTFSDDAENVETKKEEVVVEKKRSVAEETMVEINQSKREAAYRVEFRKRVKEQDEKNNTVNGSTYVRQAPASSAPSGLSDIERKNYIQRSNYINNKRQHFEENLRRSVKRQEEGGFPVDDDYIQNELDKFDAKYGRWD